MKKYIRQIIFTFFVAICLITFLGCQNTNTTENTELIIFGASSLSDVLTEIAELYEEKNENIDIKLSFASSGTLQKQIEEGAPADIFVSAGVKQMDTLEEKDLIEKNSRMDLLKNKLVVVVSKGMENRIKTMEDLTKPYMTKISIGTPEIAPVGRYAKETLVNLKLWDGIQDKLVFGKNVRQVLSYVDTENVDAGIVYQSDTKAMKKGTIALTISDELHSPILYPLAIVKESKNKDRCNDFINFLQSEEASEIFINNGFNVLK
ncbi:molybdate ABC transporter substrate-binding protein [Wukongibacter baidiensis]|uniref:molybdate ABC transporter substrate-binding protein n=1 Tax=Wukongibacter baidiensis TaxID=1723361 RepID=UPI003D7FB6C6